MKQILLALLLITATATTAQAQRYTVRHNTNGNTATTTVRDTVTMQQPPAANAAVGNTDTPLTLNLPARNIRLAGQYLTQSARYDEIAWGAVITSGACAAIGAASKKGAAAYTVAGIAGAVAIVTKVLAITAKNKAGKQLTITPATVTYHF